MLRNCVSGKIIAPPFYSFLLPNQHLFLVIKSISWDWDSLGPGAWNPLLQLVPGQTSPWPTNARLQSMGLQRVRHHCETNFPFLPFLVFYILSYLLSKRMDYLSGCLVSYDSVQKLFCGSCSEFKWSFDEFIGERVVSLSYSSAILGPPRTADSDDVVMK